LYVFLFFDLAGNFLPNRREAMEQALILLTRFTEQSKENNRVQADIMKGYSDSQMELLDGLNKMYVCFLTTTTHS